MEEIAEFGVDALLSSDTPIPKAEILDWIRKRIRDDFAAGRLPTYAIAEMALFFFDDLQKEDLYALLDYTAQTHWAEYFHSKIVTHPRADDAVWEHFFFHPNSARADFFWKRELAAEHDVARRNPRILAELLARPSIPVYKKLAPHVDDATLVDMMRRILEHYSAKDSLLFLRAIPHDRRKVVMPLVLSLLTHPEYEIRLEAQLILLEKPDVGPIGLDATSDVRRSRQL